VQGGDPALHLAVIPITYITKAKMIKDAALIDPLHILPKLGPQYPIITHPLPAMPAGLIRPIKPHATLDALSIFSASERSSRGTATVGDFPMVTITEGERNAHVDALSHISALTRALPALTISTVEARNPAATDSAQPSAASLNPDQGDLGSLGLSALSTATGMDPSSAHPQGLMGASSSADEQEVSAIKDFPVDSKILARVVESLRHALQSQDPAKGIKALLDLYLPLTEVGSRGRYGGLMGFTDDKWQKIIDDVCSSAEQACKVIGNATLKATLVKLVAAEWQKVHRVTKREHTNRTDGYTLSYRELYAWAISVSGVTLLLLVMVIWLCLENSAIRRVATAEIQRLRGSSIELQAHGQP
jgi:hypothetical protein